MDGLCKRSGGASRVTSEVGSMRRETPGSRGVKEGRSRGDEQVS